MDRYDVIVVGARVAGAATATHLARAGARVLVIDRGRYGSDILSTHAFMRGGVVALARLGVLEQLRATGTPAIERTVLRYGPTEEVVDIRPGPHVTSLLAPRRQLLDRVLVDTAIDAGADVRFGTSLTGLLRDTDGRVTGVVARTPDGHPWRVAADMTIGADGRRSRVAREAGAVTYAEGRNASAMAVGYVADVDVAGYQWLYGEGTAAGLIPTDGGLTCVWAAIPAADFDEQRTEADLGLMRVLRSIAPDLADRIGDGVRYGPIRGFPGMRGFLRQPWGRGWALVGDASHVTDPLTTHGMTDALRDAELLARAITAAGDEQAISATLADYHDTRDRLSRDLFELSDRIAGFGWTLGELRELLLAVSAAMRPEVGHLLSLDTDHDTDPDTHDDTDAALAPSTAGEQR